MGGGLRKDEKEKEEEGRKETMGKEGKEREGEKGRRGGKEERKIAQSVMVQECLI